MTLAWHGDPQLKAEVMVRLRAHREQDAIIQGVYQRYAPELAVKYLGCAIGCTLPLQPSYDDYPAMLRTPDEGWHGEVERLYGIPTLIAQHIDDLFESSDVSGAGQFAVDVIEAIPVGADLGYVAERILDDSYSAEPYEGRYGEDTPDGAANLIADLKAAPIPAMAREVDGS